MSGEADTLLRQALNLPPGERYQLARQLFDSLGDPNLPAPPEAFADEAEAEAAWQAELSRRVEEVEQHPDRLLDGEQVMAELRARRKKPRP